MSKDDKAERLAAQLRENLRKRKAQAREVGARNVAPAQIGNSGQEDTGD